MDAKNTAKGRLKKIALVKIGQKGIWEAKKPQLWSNKIF